MKEIEISIPFIYFIQLMAVIMTGYFDSRYFAFTFFTATLLLLLLFRLNNSFHSAQFIFPATILIVLFNGLGVLVQAAGSAYVSRPVRSEALKAIYAIAACHESEPDYTYIFDGEARGIAFQYGAFTGNKTTVLPSNLSSLDEESRNAFFQKIAPYRLLRSLDTSDCSTSKP